MTNEDTKSENWVTQRAFIFKESKEIPHTDQGLADKSHKITKKTQINFTVKKNLHEAAKK